MLAVAEQVFINPEGVTLKVIFAQKTEQKVFYLQILFCFNMSHVFFLWIGTKYKNLLCLPLPFTHFCISMDT